MGTKTISFKEVVKICAYSCGMIGGSILIYPVILGNYLSKGPTVIDDEITMVMSILIFGFPLSIPFAILGGIFGPIIIIIKSYWDKWMN